MLTRTRLRLPADLDGRRLDEVLVARLPAVLGRDLSRAAARRLVMAGAVSVDGRTLRRPGCPLKKGQMIAVAADLSRLERGRTSHMALLALTERDVLWEDDWLMAVAKPAGLAFHPTADARRPSLVSAVLALLAQRAGGGAVHYLAVHQRLDVGTSGVALFGLRPEANRGLARAFEERRVTKTYHALTIKGAGARRAAWTIDLALAPSGTGRRARMAVSPQGRASRTDVRVVRGFREALLVEALPRTGRKHQIRAHLAAEGLPLLGDRLYGGPARVGRLDVARPMLHALRIDLAHPVTGSGLTIECPYADDFRKALADISEPRRRRRSG